MLMDFSVEMVQYHLVDNNTPRNVGALLSSPIVF